MIYFITSVVHMFNIDGRIQLVKVIMYHCTMCCIMNDVSDTANRMFFVQLCVLQFEFPVWGDLNVLVSSSIYADWSEVSCQ